jgi:hypothetical protein
MENIENKNKVVSQSTDDDKLENVIHEPEAIYQTQEIDDFEMPQEWIDEADERGRRMDSGEDKGYTHEEIMKMAYEHLATFKKRQANV